jgi:hypothetical protein
MYANYKLSAINQVHELTADSKVGMNTALEASGAKGW